MRGNIWGRGLWVLEISDTCSINESALTYGANDEAKLEELIVVEGTAAQRNSAPPSPSTSADRKVTIAGNTGL